jgi:tetratricopeptide (TPR) repeat protein
VQTARQAADLTPPVAWANACFGTGTRKIVLNTSAQFERRALRAALLLESDRAARARNFLRRALKQRTSRIVTTLALDAQLEHSGKREEHVALLREAISLSPEPYVSYFVYRLARIEFLRGHLESALRLVRDRRTWPEGHLDQREPRLLESAVLRVMGRRTEALALAEPFQHEDLPAPVRMRARFHRAAALQALGRIEEVEPEYRRALALTVPLRAARMRALIFTNLSLTAASCGDTSLACAYAREGARRLEALGDELMLGKALASVARHDPTAIERARAVATKVADREALTELAILDVLHDKARARVSLRESLWDNETLGLETLAAKTRAALTVLESEQSRHLVVGAHRATLVDGSSRRTIELSRHEKLLRLLRRLAIARENQEGALTVETLLVSVWPGELLVGNSGPNRVYTAIRSLRRFGLEDVLRSSSAGYELTCGVRFEL